MKKLTVKQRAKRAKRAADALNLSLITKADHLRLAHVVDGLFALDEEQADLKGEIELLCDEAPGAWVPVAALRALIGRGREEVTGG